MNHSMRFAIKTLQGGEIKVDDVGQVLGAMRDSSNDVETVHLLDFLHRSMQEELLRMRNDESWREIGSMPGR